MQKQLPATYAYKFRDVPHRRRDLTLLLLILRTDSSLALFDKTLICSLYDELINFCSHERETFANDFLLFAQTSIIFDRV